MSPWAAAAVAVAEALRKLISTYADERRAEATALRSTVDTVADRIIARARKAAGNAAPAST